MFKVIMYLAGFVWVCWSVYLATQFPAKELRASMKDMKDSAKKTNKSEAGKFWLQCISLCLLIGAYFIRGFCHIIFSTIHTAMNYTLSNLHKHSAKADTNETASSTDEEIEPEVEAKVVTESKSDSVND